MDPQRGGREGHPSPSQPVTARAPQRPSCQGVSWNPVTTLAEPTPLHEYGCLFCRRADGGFTSREHIFSEALGNFDEHVLPPGVVCDRCNNEKLSAADEALIGFQP